MSTTDTTTPHDTTEHDTTPTTTAHAPVPARTADRMSAHVHAEPAPAPVPPTRRRSRAGVLTAAVSVALISTASAYLAMVAFGVDVLGMSDGIAYATAGVFELSLVTVALLAREAAKDNRPGGVLLTLTWALSAASGVFAAWHELFIDNPLGAAIFRFLVPLLAALMWHLALIGDRHLATGISLDKIRRDARERRKARQAEKLMLAYIVASERVRDAVRSGIRAEKIDALLRREVSARNDVLSVLTVEEFDERYESWAARLVHAEAARANLFRLGALPEVDQPIVPATPHLENEGAPAQVEAPAAPMLTAVPAAGEVAEAPVAVEDVPASDSPEHVRWLYNHRGMTQDQIVEHLAGRGIKTSRATVSRRLKASGVSTSTNGENGEGFPAVAAVAQAGDDAPAEDDAQSVSASVLAG